LKILVTGASGFVGGAFMRRFAGRGDLELFGVGRRPVDAPNYAQVDLSKRFNLPLAPDVVLHAAARASPWGTKRDFYEQNVLATRNVVDFCTRRGLPRLLYVSSSSVFYREEHQHGIRESSPIGPSFVNDYAATKFQGEQELQRYRGEKVILRPRAVFGPGDTVLFPRILAAARKGALPRFVGQREPVVGDLIYIETLCDYLLAAALHPHPAPSYNLTNGEAVDIQQLLLRTLQRLDIPAPSRQLSVRSALALASVIEAVYRLLHLPGEPPLTRFGIGVFAYCKTFDPSLAQSDLGPPSVSLADGIERFVQWQQAQWATEGDGA